MNVLPLILSILLILTYGFYSCLDRESAVYRIHKTFASQAKLSRQIQGSYEREAYDAIKAAKKARSPEKKTPPKPREKRKKEPPKVPLVNPECARLNLYPLVYEDKEKHPLLYEELANLLRLFYQKPLFGFFSDRSGLEYVFLDTWLASLKKIASKQSKEDPIFLEKTALKDASLQILYYNMLQGSKDKYPPLLDFVKMTRPLDLEERVCLLDATPQMLAVFFGPAAQAVYEEMHSETIAVTDERLEELCRNAHAPLQNKDVLKLLNPSRLKHLPPSEITLCEEDKETKISVRRKVYRPNKTNKGF